MRVVVGRWSVPVVIAEMVLLLVEVDGVAADS